MSHIDTTPNEERRVSFQNTIERITRPNAKAILANVPNPELIELARVLSSDPYKRFCVTLSREDLLEALSANDAISASVVKVLEAAGEHELADFQQKFQQDRSMIILSLAMLLLYDPLTGALRKQFLEHQFAVIHELAKETPLSVSIVFIDINFFKLYNDCTDGKHATGDRCLARIGEALSKWCRPNEYLIRYGGDEFALLSYSERFENPLGFLRTVETACNGALNSPGLLSESERQHISNVSGMNDDAITFSVSTGMVIHDGNEITRYVLGRQPTVEASTSSNLFETLVGAADASMYIRKSDMHARSGRTPGG